MALVAEFTVPADSLALSAALNEHPDVLVEAGQLVAHSPNTTMPCLWASGGDQSAFDDAVAADPTVDRVETSVEFDREVLYHLSWNDEVERRVAEMVDHEGVFLEAAGSGDSWRVKLRFVTRDQFEEFRDHFVEGSGAFRLEQLFEARLPRQRRGAVTPEQYRALTTAAELGYFEVPREAALRDVAEVLGVSHQAVSERLRRGTGNLVRDALLDAGPRDGY